MLVKVVKCSPVSKAGNHVQSLFNLLLGLHPTVENRAVTALTQNLLVETALAPLALDPQVAVLLLEDLELLLALDVDIADAALTVCAHNVLGLL